MWHNSLTRTRLGSTIKRRLLHHELVSTLCVKKNTQSCRALVRPQGRFHPEALFHSCQQGGARKQWVQSSWWNVYKVHFIQGQWIKSQQTLNKRWLKFDDEETGEAKSAYNHTAAPGGLRRYCKQGKAIKRSRLALLQHQNESNNN